MRLKVVAVFWLSFLTNSLLYGDLCSLDHRITNKVATLQRFENISTDFKSGDECGLLLSNLYAQMIEAQNLLDDIEIDIHEGFTDLTYNSIQLTTKHAQIVQLMLTILDRVAFCTDASESTINKMKNWAMESNDKLLEDYGEIEVVHL